MSISKKRIKQLKSVKEKNIDYSDIPELDEQFFKNAKLELPPKKEAISFRVDSEILEWFRALGEGYQTRMNAVLRAFVKAHKS